MRRIVAWFISTVAVVVLLFSYRTSTMGPAAGGTSQIAGPTGAAGGDAGAVETPGTTAGTDATAGTGTGTGATGRSASGTFKGSAVSTRYGPVQVQIEVAGGRIVDVAVLQVPNTDRRDQEINGYAVPILRQAALDAQSADIDTVSGATYTSEGYRRSLQSALDAAHLG